MGEPREGQPSPRPRHGWDPPARPGLPPRPPGCCHPALGPQQAESSGFSPVLEPASKTLQPGHRPRGHRWSHQPESHSTCPPAGQVDLDAPGRGAHEQPLPAAGGRPEWCTVVEEQGSRWEAQRRFTPCPRPPDASVETQSMGSRVLGGRPHSNVQRQESRPPGGRPPARPSRDDGRISKGAGPPRTAAQPRARGPAGTRKRGAPSEGGRTRGEDGAHVLRSLRAKRRRKRRALSPSSARAVDGRAVSAVAGRGGVAPGGGSGSDGSRGPVSFWGDANVSGPDPGGVTQHCECTKLSLNCAF